MRAGIQNDLIFRDFTGFRVSPKMVRLARNDSFWRIATQSLKGEEETG
jgi:hypothetical protein